MTSLSEVIDSSVDNEGSSNDGVVSTEHDKVILDLVLGDAVLSGSNVAEIANMSLLHVWATMGFTRWVVMWTGSLASLCEITELVDVESVKAWGQPGDLCTDLAFSTVFLSQLDEAFHAGVSVWVHDANCVVGLVLHIFSIKPIIIIG